jgi:hypothetical protein
VRASRVRTRARGADCDAALVAFALVLSVVMAKMVVQRRPWVYSSVVVITIASFTFASLVSSVVRVRRARPATPGIERFHEMAGPMGHAAPVGVSFCRWTEAAQRVAGVSAQRYRKVKR